MVNIDVEKTVTRIDIIAIRKPLPFNPSIDVVGKPYRDMLDLLAENNIDFRLISTQQLSSGRVRAVTLLKSGDSVMCECHIIIAA